MRADLPNLSRLTIIIPSLNRQSYALRNMRFWSGRGPTVHVIDGTRRALPSRELREVGTNIHYHHRPGTLAERLVFASGLVGTPYAALCGDDEFFPPTGIDACISFLDSHTEYTACCGRSVGFFPRENRLALIPVKSFHREHAVDQSSIEDRIQYHMGNFMVTTIYAVHRAQSFATCLAMAGGENFSSPYVAESLFELFAAAQGKSKVISNVSWLRSYENRPVHSTRFDRSRSISEWYDDPSAAGEVNRLNELLRDGISRVAPPETRDRLWTAAADAFRRRVEADRITQSSKPKLRARRSRLRAILRPVRQWLGRALGKRKAVTSQDFYAGPGSYSYESLMHDEGVVLDEAEIAEIFDTVLRFHSTHRSKWRGLPPIRKTHKEETRSSGARH